MFVSDPQFNVEINAWLSCALLFAVRLMAPGLAWLWLWPDGSDVHRPRAGKIILTAQAALTGLLASLTVVISLAAVNRYTETAEWIALAAVTLIGLVIGLLTGKLKLADRLRALLPGSALLAIGFGVIMLLPRRGEWVLGGWDPGIYISQGVSMSRAGSLHPVPDLFFSEISDEDLSLFTRPRHTYIEAQPVVPLDRVHRTLQPFFFPGTPALIALLYRCGGLRAATRINDFAGLLAALAFTAAALGLLRRGPAAAFALIALIAQPLWLYHTHFPTSEMLQLTLLSGLALVFPQRFRSLGAAILLGALLCMAEINRFSFLPFGLLFVFLLACDDLRRAGPSRMEIERSLQFGGLGIGTLFAYFSNPANMERLYDTVPSLLGSALVLALAIVGMDTRILPEVLLRRIPRGLNHLALPVGLGGLALVLLLASLNLLPGPGWLPWASRGAVHFIGPAWLILAALGSVFLFRPGEPENPETRIWCLFLLAAAAVSLLNPEIATVLPWAARRNLEFGVPLVALLAAGLPSVLWAAGKTRIRGRVAAILVCLLPLAWHGRSAAKAWSGTEHDGLTGILAEIADHTKSSDIIVADHFRWGTPLRFLYDRTVINGELFLEPRKFARMPEALQVLASLNAQGRRIRFLVSTEADVGVFPVVPSPITLDWESPEWLDREIVHSPRAQRVELKEKTRRFRLYTWEPNR
ncbi:MAG: hypothetical protein KKC51_08440 [Verrucomicrobia bacterium]|nr:hypothetical protein [Verrucomicrobiota bacterium]